MNIFISYNSKNSGFVLGVVEKLKNLNAQINVQQAIFFDLDNLEAGQNWTKEIQDALQLSNACIVFIGEEGIGKWQNKEVLTAIKRLDASQGEFKIIPVIIPHGKREKIQKNIPWFLADIQWIEFAHETDPDAFQKLKDAILNQAVLFPFNPAVCPYKGLDFFDVEDAAFFFGRTFDTNWVFYKKLQLHSKIASRFLAVIGDSGSGKSSFARAGILANLKADRFANSKNWKQLIFSPEDNPLLKLSAALQSSDIIADAKKMEEDAKTDSSTLRRILEVYGHRVTLMVDQFEEVITQCKDHHQREAFLSNITEAIKSQYLVCIITMRSDFYAAFSPFREFADLLEANNYTITSLDFNTSGEEWERYLRAIIQKPAQLLNVRFEPVLTTQIIEDCKKINGVLPALQLALVGLWKKGVTNSKIESAGYDSLTDGKGIAGIIEAHANNTWNVLTADGTDKQAENLIKAIFIRLIEITSSKEDVRKTVNRTTLIEELRSQFDQGEVEKMITTLSGPDTRLIRIKKDEVNNNIYWAEVIHEVLIRQWDMLRKWVNERREAIHEKNKLEQYIDDDNKIITGKKLAYAEQWISNNKDLVTPKISSFITRSRQGVNKRKYAFGIGAATLILLAIIAGLLYPVVQCKNCSLVTEVLKYGNYKDDDVHTLTLSGTKDIKNLRCFKNLDTLVLQMKTGEDYLSQAGIDLLPRTLKQLTIKDFFTNDTILEFKSFSKLQKLTVSALKGLRKLKIANLDSLTELTLAELENFSGLEGIESLSKLQALNLSGLGNFPNLLGIEKLENLRALDLSGLDNLSSLAGANNLKNLHALTLFRLPIVDLSDISNMKTLQRLDLSELNITSLDVIKNLKNLQTLSLKNLPDLHNIQDLANLQEQVQELTINLHLDSLGVIQNCRNLQTLSLSGLRITNLTTLANFGKLHTLSLSSLDNLESIEGIEKLNTLRTLALSDLKLLDNIDPIKTLTKLQTLSLSKLKGLFNLSGIESLEDLRSLTLSELAIDTLSAVRNLHNLEVIGLKDLPISNLSGIENLKSLKVLTLSELHIPDLAGVENIKSLLALSISYLDKVSLAGLGNFKNLQVLSLSNLSPASLAGIEQLTNIRFLYLDNIGESRIVSIPKLISQINIDTMVVYKIKLQSLEFLDEKMKLKTFIYNNELELLNREKEFSLISTKMKETRFINLSVLRGPFDERLPFEIMQ